MHGQGEQGRSRQENYFKNIRRLNRASQSTSSDHGYEFVHSNDSEMSLGHFDIPAVSYSPDRYTRGSRRNSHSPIHEIYSRSPSVSPSRVLLQNQSSYFLSGNPFTIPELPQLKNVNYEHLNTHSGKKHGTQSIPLYEIGPTEDPFDDKYKTHDDPSCYDHLERGDFFGGYEFDDDELEGGAEENFDPFPVLGNSYYPINTPYDVYNPFEVEYSSDNSSDGSVSVSSTTNTASKSSLLTRRDSTFKNAKAVAKTVEFYNNGEHIDEDVTNPSAKQVRMVDGNLVLDCPISEILLNKYKVPLSEKDREFLFMRFQACTAEPEEFQQKKFSLRQLFYTKPRETELMIVITMYNEDEILLARTLKGVMKNIRYLYSLKNSSTWGKNSWQKIVVCIVSDGRQKLNPRSKALLTALGVYQDGFAKNQINDEEVISHIYEYTTMVGISKIYNDCVTLTTENQVPIQMVFCLKEQNKQKINSHKWAFKAFAPVLKPNVIILLDVGTQPENKSLYKLWKSFKDNPRVAGSCGEIKASLGKGWRLLLNPLIAAQNFEYKVSNILDKPMESVFGFVTVLPGAFSAYRYEALLGEPMDKYLRGEDLSKNNEDGIFNANMYLAEDRILCFELIAKKNEKWILKYIHSAGAYTDVPERIDDFISQRRRWLNGSFFAALYSVCKFFKIWSTNHSFGRKIMLQVQFVYQLLNLLVSFFSLGSYFLVFRILSCYLAEPSVKFAPGNILSVFFLWLYMASLATTFVLSFGNKPKGTRMFYLIIVVFFAILMCYMIFASILLSVQSFEEIIGDKDFSWDFIFVKTQFRNLIISTLSTYVLYLIGFIMFLQPIHMFTSFIQYLLLSPAYVNILNIYAFCNMHDISWGTKGQDKVNDLGVAKKGSSDKDELEIVIPTTKYQIDEGYSSMVKELMVPRDSGNNNTEINLDEKTVFYFAFFRSMAVLVWMFSNFILVAVVTETGGLSQLFPNSDSESDSILPEKQSFIFLSVILYIVAFMALFRFLGSSIYLIQRGLNKIGYRT